MSLEVILLVSFLFNSLLVLLVLFLVYKGDKVVNEFEPYLKDVEVMRHSIAKRGSVLLERTVDVAQEIIRNALMSSQRNIKTSENFQEELQERLVNSLEQSVSETKKLIQERMTDVLETYSKEILKFNTDLNASAEGVRKEMLITTGNKLFELSQAIQEEISQVRKSVDEKITQKLSSADEEIKKYKEEKLKDLNEKIYLVIDEAVKKVINRSIDLAEHEDVVLSALEKARKENLL
jgi:hypothetical protein